MSGTIMQQYKIIIKHFTMRHKQVISQTKVNSLPISGYIANKIKSKLIGFIQIKNILCVRVRAQLFYLTEPAVTL